MVGNFGSGGSGDGRRIREGSQELPECEKMEKNAKKNRIGITSPVGQSNRTKLGNKTT
jgi:hypothetical protein